MVLSFCDGITRMELFPRWILIFLFPRPAIRSSSPWRWMYSHSFSSQGTFLTTPASAFVAVWECKTRLPSPKDSFVFFCLTGSRFLLGIEALPSVFCPPFVNCSLTSPASEIVSCFFGPRPDFLCPDFLPFKHRPFLLPRRLTPGRRPSFFPDSVPFSHHLLCLRSFSTFFANNFCYFLLCFPFFSPHASPS